MTPLWRDAARADVPAVVALLADDVLGQDRETAPAETYLAAFDAMREERGNRLLVGEVDGRVVACYQLVIVQDRGKSQAKFVKKECFHFSGRFILVKGQDDEADDCQDTVSRHNTPVRVPVALRQGPRGSGGRSPDAQRQHRQMWRSSSIANIFLR